MVSDNNNSIELENNIINVCSDLNISKMLKMLYYVRYSNKLDIPNGVENLCL